MKSLLVICLFFLVSITVSAQDTIPGQVIRVDTIVVEKVRVDTVREVVQVPVQQTVQTKDASPVEPKKSSIDKTKLYYGGYANFSIGNYTVIGFEPMVGYKLTPKFSVGSKLTYEYVKDKRYAETYETSSYGASVFTRLRIVPSLYAHAELSGMSYKLFDSSGNSKRKMVPFFYVGGGYSVPITKNTWFTAQVLFDVWQHKNSPYKAWDPYFSAGFGIGF